MLCSKVHGDQRYMYCGISVMKTWAIKVVSAVFWKRNTQRKRIKSISHYKLLLHIQLLFQMRIVYITGWEKKDTVSISSVSIIKILCIWLYQFYPINLILSQNEELVVPRIPDGLTHVVRLTVIVAEYLNLFTFIVLKWKKVFQCENETC